MQHFHEHFVFDVEKNLDNIFYSDLSYLEATGRRLCPFVLLFRRFRYLLLISFSPLCLRVALETLDRLTESLDFTDYASRIIHPIVRTLDSTPELRTTSMDTLSSLVFQLGKKVAIAIPTAFFSCSYYTEDYFQPPYCWLHMSRISVTHPPRPTASHNYFLPDY